MVKEIGPHEGCETGRMMGGHADIFVQIEGGDGRKIDLPRSPHRDKPRIKRAHGFPGCKPQHRMYRAGQERRDNPGGPFGGSRSIGQDQNLHSRPPSGEKSRQAEASRLSEMSSPARRSTRRGTSATTAAPRVVAVYRYRVAPMFSTTSARRVSG